MERAPRAGQRAFGGFAHVGLARAFPASTCKPLKTEKAVQVRLPTPKLHQLDRGKRIIWAGLVGLNGVDSSVQINTLIFTKGSRCPRPSPFVVVNSVDTAK